MRYIIRYVRCRATTAKVLAEILGACRGQQDHVRLGPAGSRAIGLFGIADGYQAAPLRRRTNSART